MLRIICSTLLVVCFPAAMWADERFDFFESKIRPVLIEHCYACHSDKAKQIEGGLRVDSRPAMLRGGTSGAAVEPGKVAKSLLISAIKYESLEMPPNKKLSAEIIADFEKWIELGAADPREESEQPRESIASKIDFVAAAKFWSFQPPQLSQLPDSIELTSHNRIDNFILAGLAAQSLQPAPRAESTTLLRRLAFDLVGLPPTAAQLSQRDQMSDSDGYREMVDELIASPAFGEHWARMWLDIMRFAEDQAHIVGDDTSLFFPNSYLYRDWVIAALNNDMPYDEFLRLQLAADLLTPDDPTDDVALGFIGLGPKYYRRNAPEVMAEEWEDRIDVISRGLMGLTVACARCHDHKFDPISTADYYALAGVFASTEMYNRPLDPKSELKDNGQTKSEKDALHIVRDIQPKDLSVMIRGDVNRLGPNVPRGFLTVLSGQSVSQETTRVAFRHGSGRLELADQIVSSDNPLVARVLVNRVWSRLMGSPIVATPSNFGSLGERPTHPELLDDLSVRFMQQGWSIKWLCREIALSATYQQASSNEKSSQVDPENRWLARMHRKRLQVEQWRDAILTATAHLQPEIGGPSVDPTVSEVARRTIYSQASRLKLNSMLALFDYPDANTHSEKRAQTTTASQKLFLMNSPLLVKSSQSLSERLKAQKLTRDELLKSLYHALYSREPTVEEANIVTSFLSPDYSNLHELTHALMMANEMFFVD